MSVTLSPIITKTIAFKNDESDGFLRKLAALVAQIYATFSQISQNDRLEINSLEFRYKEHSFESADLMRTRGNLSLGFATISVLLFAASLGFANTNDTKFIQLIAEKTPDLLKLFDSSREANIKNRETLAQIEGIRLQEKNTKTQNENGTKEQFAQVLQAEIQRLRTAAANSN